VETFGINLVGTFTKRFSLAYVACSLAESLIDQNVPLSLLNVQFEGDATPAAFPRHLAAYERPAAAGLAHPVTLYVLPAVVLPDLMAAHAWLRDPRRIHVANLWWEFAALPSTAAQEVLRHDVILAHTDFIANLAAAHAPGTHVVKTPLNWRIACDAEPDRSRFGLPASGTAFLFVYDADSEYGTIDPSTGHSRKNPWELIDAFRLAFPASNDDVHLVIRATNLEKPSHAALRERLLAAARGDGRIRVLSGAMQFADVMSLTASCDVYVSLHRAEGLGLGMLEAMAVGKPVIASAWSGNLSFMNLANSCPVRCRLVPLREGYRYWGVELPPGTVWAEPIKEDAAAFMRLLHQDRSFREAVGRRARAAYEAHQAAARQETWIDELRAFYQTFPHRPRIAGKYSAG
jgi:glycosyltransferase involved in cell wall biosynthesis